VTTFLGMAALMRGDEGQTAPMFEEGLAVARRIGDRTSTFIALYNLAQAALCRNDYDGAAPHFKEGVTLSEQMEDRANVAYCLEGLAVVTNARRGGAQWAPHRRGRGVARGGRSARLRVLRAPPLDV
jgi:hypothetical protein